MGISTDIALWCQRLWDSILAISTDIALWCQRLWDSILELPNVIAEGIKDIFVPDSGYIDEAYSAFVEELKFKFNLDTTVFESLFDNETPVQDQYVEYSIFGLGNVKFKALDTEFLRDGVSYFRPFIRGFFASFICSVLPSTTPEL